MRKTVDLKQSIDEVRFGMFLITAAHNGKDNIQRSFRVITLSEKPVPRIGVALLTDYNISDLIRKSGYLAICVAGPKHIPTPRPQRDQRPEVDDEFIAIGAVKTRATILEAPLVEDCSAYLECALEQEVIVQDRSLFICRVIACQVDDSIVPPVRVRGRDIDLTQHAP